MVENEFGDPKASVNKYVVRTLKSFKNEKSTDSLNEILEVFMSFWNNWPHKSLGNKSPSNMMTEAISKNKKNRTKTQDPVVRVGNTEMSWDNYKIMLKRMEEAQAPFKKWLKKELFPHYFAFLKNEYSKRIYENRKDVCKVFFKQCLYLGFIDLEKIRVGYALVEFPYWWQNHILWKTLSETRIRGYVRDIFVYIDKEYGRWVEGLLEFN
jgi:hypothetical protein